MDTFATSSINNLSASEAAFAGGIVGTMLIAFCVFAVLVIIGQWRIFEKAGEKGWKSLIPIYGQYILFKIAGAKCWFWWLLGITLCASIMMSVNNIPVDFNAPQAQIDAQIAAINWSEHVPYIIGMIATCVVSFAADVALCVKLSKAFGKGVAYMLGLFFVPEIVLLVLGFGKAKYDKKAVK